MTNVQKNIHRSVRVKVPYKEKEEKNFQLISQVPNRDVEFGNKKNINEQKTNIYNIDQLSVNTIRTLCIDAVQRANSGHPGAPMGLSAVGYVLFKHFLKNNPGNSEWIDRDRFVLSGGHVSILLYSLLYLFGYGLDLDDLKAFRQWGSRTPGHPEYGRVPGIETTTGPLGQGIANAVGMAIAERHLAERFNRKGGRIVDHNTYVLCGDGDLMEGVALEAVSLAGHLGLGKLVLIYDDNSITIEGRTDITFTEDINSKFESMDWHVVTVHDGNDLDAIQRGIQAGQAEISKPSLVRIKTHIGYGSPNKQDTPGAHGAPLGVEEIKKAKEFYKVPDIDFYVPDIVLRECRKSLKKGEMLEKSWQNVFDGYKARYPELASEFLDAVNGLLTEGWDSDIPWFDPEDEPLATRTASGRVLNVIADNLSTLMGGSADLSPSNNTYMEKYSEFQKDSYEGRNMRFGVREHAMGAIMSGMYLHSGIRPYGGTFLVFADYMRPAIRIAALMRIPLIYVFTHDSIAVGEDGPTHQPVEHLASLRAIPGLNVLRPADANEAALAWKCALKSTDSPTALVLSRQKLPVLDISGKDREFNYGAYIVRDAGTSPDIIFIASGSEVHLCLEASEILEKDHQVKVSVVSMPSWELFEKAPESYKEKIFPSFVKKRLAVEAGVTMGWRKYVGDEGKVIGIDKFGNSAPGGVLLEKYGFSVENVLKNALDFFNNPQS